MRRTEAESLSTRSGGSNSRGRDKGRSRSVGVMSGRTGASRSRIRRRSTSRCRSRRRVEEGAQRGAGEEVGIAGVGIHHNAGEAVVIRARSRSRRRSRRASRRRGRSASRRRSEWRSRSRSRIEPTLCKKQSWDAGSGHDVSFPNLQTSRGLGVQGKTDCRDAHFPKKF